MIMIMVIKLSAQSYLNSQSRAAHPHHNKKKSSSSSKVIIMVATSLASLLLPSESPSSELQMLRRETISLPANEDEDHIIFIFIFVITSLNDIWFTSENNIWVIFTSGNDVWGVVPAWFYASQGLLLFAQLNNQHDIFGEYLQ